MAHLFLSLHNFLQKVTKTLLHCNPDLHKHSFYGIKQFQIHLSEVQFIVDHSSLQYLDKLIDNKLIRWTLVLQPYMYTILDHLVNLITQRIVWGSFITIGCITEEIREESLEWAYQVRSFIEKLRSPQHEQVVLTGWAIL